jgi:hypothetical protein
MKVFLLTVLYCSCTNKSPSKIEAIDGKDEPINSIQIHLYPAFNNSSIIAVDPSSRSVSFSVDTTITYRQGRATSFRVSLDSFRLYTLIDSFYSRSFLESVRFKPEGYGVTDGLSIYTIIQRNSKSDTINSGNVYPRSLSNNIVSQIDYISKSINDRPLKKYIDDLKSYFN